MKELKVKQPLICCYTNYGILFSLLPDDMMPWVYNNFIQIRYNRDWKTVTFDNHILMLSYCPALSFRSIPFYIHQELCGGKIQDFVIDSIDHERYVFMYVDRFYLKNSDEYKNIHRSHEIFIYGYDEEKKVFYIADNLDQGRFIFTECGFSELEESFEAADKQYEFMADIGLIHENIGVKSEINIGQIVDGLERYLMSIPTYDMKPEQPYLFGRDVVRYIRDNYLIHSNGEDIDIRAFHLLYEHKLLMEMRVEYLLNAGYISPKQVELNEFTELKNGYLQLRNAIIKYNLTKNTNTLNRSVLKMDELIYKEEVILKKLLQTYKTMESDNKILTINL